MASSSTTPPMIRESTKLRLDSSLDEYETWKELLLGHLRRANLIGFIDGSLPMPLETNSQAHREWKRIDRGVKNWIFDELNNDLTPLLMGEITSRDVFINLDTFFTTQSHRLPPPTTSPLQGGGNRMRLSLYQAALSGDWNATKEILDEDPSMAEARVEPRSDTVLHIAVGTGKAIPYLRNLAAHLGDDTVALENDDGMTALEVAARTGNLEAARILVERRRDLLYASDKWGMFPIVKAAMSAHRPTIEFFMSETRHDEIEGTNPYADDNGVLLLNTLISSDFMDSALVLIDNYPELAKKQHSSGHSPLRTLALQDAAFQSGARLNFWERLIYSSIQLEMESEQDAADIENPSCCTLIPREFGRWHNHRDKVVRYLHATLYKVIRPLGRHAKWIHELKARHQLALKLVKRLCKEMESLSHDDAFSIYADAVLNASKLGIHEVVETIVGTFPLAIYCTRGSSMRYLFHIAVENRCEKVFNLLYQMSNHKDFVLARDYSGDNLLHIVSNLAPSHKLNLISGAALQMQRELQWFKEVEKFVAPSERKKPNNEGKTPQMIFTDEHSNLRIEGEKWMKDTANSCSIAAALIATVVFAAAITVPGGNADTGYPLFVKSSAFIIFAVSDAISLFTSSTSLLMFLSILTSRYAEEDFLYALPKRLCVGLFTLFLSILFMTAAFSATIFLVFAKKSVWVLIPVAALACLPVTSFVLLQFPLLVDVVSSTYGRGIFGKQSDRPFH